MILSRTATVILAGIVYAGLAGWPAEAAEQERLKIAVPSSLDGTEQPAYLILPAGVKPDTESDKEVPLLVSLHTWSSNVEQRLGPMEAAGARRGWVYLFPDFRGANRSPDACGSEKAQQDILDAVDWVVARYPIDTRRIYLTGVSGGGHMAMLMAGRHPRRWTAVSAWVGISDLAAWEARHTKGGYGAMVRASCGGRPGDSETVDRAYHDRSPIHWMAGAVDVPLDLSAGVHDGYKGSVPIRHTLDAFNRVAQAQKAPVITEAEIAQLSRPGGRLTNPQPSDQVKDPTLGRAIHLRRTAGKARVTIFEGGHERLDEASAAWLEQYVKP